MRRSAALAALLLAVSAIVVAQPAPDWYQGKTIKDIRFEGLEVVAITDLDDLIKEYKGSAFSDDLWEDLLARVYSLDYFDQISPEAVPSDASYSAVIIVFKVVERAAVATVTVSGNQGLRTGEILDVATIKPRTIFNQSRLRLDEIAIRQLYQKKGYAEVTVSSSWEARPDGSVDVSYDVVEGYRNIVERIEFEGIVAFSAKSLKGDIALKEKALFQSGDFSEAKLEASIADIEAYYRNRGYIDAKVLDVQRAATETDDRNRLMTLTFVVSEGSRYLFDGMSFMGNTVFPSDELAKLVRHKVGVMLNYQRLIDDQTRVADLYFDNGYIFNGFELRENRDEERGTIAYILTITERQQALVERIEFRGNAKTKEHVLRREIPIADGDVFSKAKIMEGLRNLYNLQYFSAITPEYEPGAQDPYVVLVINVEEQSTADIQFGLSFVPSNDADSFPLQGLIKWNDRNFLGQGQTFSVGANVSPDTQDLTLAFTENWLMDRRWSGGVSFSFKHEGLSAPTDNDFNGIPDPYATWEEYTAAGQAVPEAFRMDYNTYSLSLGLSTGYTFKFAPGDLGLGGGYLIGLNNKSYDDTVNHPYDDAISSNLDRWLLSNTLYFRTYFNALDLWYDPANGYFFSQRLALNGFFPNELSRFWRSDTKMEAYLTLVDTSLFDRFPLKLVLGAHSGFSALMPWFGESEVIAADTDKLRIDGTFVGRGWGGALGSVLGTSLWENWVELRYPVVPGVLSLDGFFDATALMTPNGLLDVGASVATGATVLESQGWDALSGGNFAFSLGFGLRFAIPQFPFRIYMAKRFYVDPSGSLEWANPGGGLDFVLSITQPLY
ncbi:MAG: outer membrane protein assembly factor BamA [Spirochaetales bacterium]|nr:outer membrane protein assembly factor BamA [Spirochaetales bacterium]